MPLLYQSCGQPNMHSLHNNILPIVFKPRYQCWDKTCGHMKDGVLLKACIPSLICTYRLEMHDLGDENTVLVCLSQFMQGTIPGEYPTFQPPGPWMYISLPTLHKYIASLHILSVGDLSAVNLKIKHHNLWRTTMQTLCVLPASQYIAVLCILQWNLWITDIAGPH